MRIPRRRFIAGMGLTAAGLTVGAHYASARPWFIPFAPKPPPYPDYADEGAVAAYQKQLSEALDAYIRAWMDGHAPARLPEVLIPKSIPRAEFSELTLVRPEDITAKEQWLVRAAHDGVNSQAVQGYFPDPYCTYLLLPLVVAPVGSRVVIEGQFPHARFFDWQATPPCPPRNYHNGYYGVPEVPILDADIEPKPGSINPFRPGADRRAAKRDYRVVFEIKDGDPVALNPRAFRPPDFRDRADKTNTRAAGAFFYQGPGQYGAKPVPDFRDRFALATGLVDAQYVRETDRALEGRGEGMPPPGDYEHAATECPYITYLNRGMALGPGRICVLTGRLPTTPHTRSGEKTLTPAQARYWSLTGYDIAWPEKDGFGGAALHSVMDEDIVTDADHNYVIVLSRPEDRPANAAPPSGVTWVNWGPTARVSWTLRWMSTPPEFDFPLSPHQGHLGWETDWAGLHYDPTRLGTNTRAGFLGAYQPIVHYLTRAEFERLGSRVTAGAVPVWR